MIMLYHVIKIEDGHLKAAIDALNAFDVKHSVAGFPDAEVILIERYQSRINSKPKNNGQNNKKLQHEKMRLYAIEKGFKDVSSAISAMGGHVKFKKKFFDEYRSITDSRNVVHG